MGDPHKGTKRKPRQSLVYLLRDKSMDLTMTNGILERAVMKSNYDYTTICNGFRVRELLDKSWPLRMIVNADMMGLQEI